MMIRARPLLAKGRREGCVAHPTRLTRNRERLIYVAG